MSKVAASGWTDSRIDSRGSRCNRSCSVPRRPMNELVRSILNSRPRPSIRISSFAGHGLTERMRSTAFALLGLTAAAGLALVALFAQPGFPLLEPAPLPEEPPPRQSIAEARRVTTFRAQAVPVAPRARSTAAGETGPDQPDQRRPSGSGGGAGPPAPVPAAAPTPTPAPAPAAAPGPSSGGGKGAEGDGGGSSPPPASGAEPPAAATATSTPVASPAPVPPPPATTSSPPVPPTPTGPGNSSSTAAAEHASERGTEASSPAAVVAAGAVAASDGGDGEGLAKGHYK
jgi:hypothetical protein